MVAGIKPWVSPTSVACGSKGKKSIYGWTLTYEQSVLTRTPHTNELWLHIKLTNTSLELANVWAVIFNVISFFFKKSVQLPTIRLTNTFTGTHYVRKLESTCTAQTEVISDIVSETVSYIVLTLGKAFSTDSGTMCLRICYLSYLLITLSLTSNRRGMHRFGLIVSPT
jgi:hypothetical protein